MFLSRCVSDLIYKQTGSIDSAIMSNNDAEINDGDAENMASDTQKPEKMFTLKKWNAVAMWSWDVECDTCAICRVQVMGKSNLVVDIIALQGRPSVT